MSAWENCSRRATGPLPYARVPSRLSSSAGGGFLWMNGNPGNASPSASFSCQETGRSHGWENLFFCIARGGAHSPAWTSRLGGGGQGGDFRPGPARPRCPGRHHALHRTLARRHELSVGRGGIREILPEAWNVLVRILGKRYRPRDGSMPGISLFPGAGLQISSQTLMLIERGCYVPVRRSTSVFLTRALCVPDEPNTSLRLRCRFSRPPCIRMTE